MKSLLAAAAAAAIASTAYAGSGPIPAEYHGFWGAGGCANPAFFLNIEDSGIQGYGPDKRTPVGNWDVRQATQAGGGLTFDAPETNSGTLFHFELSKAREGWLLIKTRSPQSADQAEYESCSPHTQ